MLFTCHHNSIAVQRINISENNLKPNSSPPLNTKMSKPFTYTGSYFLTARKPITKGDMVELCKDLNKQYEATGITFQPEAITEGGIQYNLPSTFKRAYKSIRMYFHKPTIKRRSQFIPFDKSSLSNYRVSKKHLQKLGLLQLAQKHYLVMPDISHNDPNFLFHLSKCHSVNSPPFDWPSVHPNVMKEWENNPEVILEAGLSIQTYLKAFHGAPVFTQSELQLFGDCTAKIGLVIDSKVPKDKELICSRDSPLGKY